MTRSRPDSSAGANPPAQSGGILWSVRPFRSGRSAAAALLLGACGFAPQSPDGLVTPIRVAGYSYNRSDVDVYLTCGVREGTWLGSVPGRGSSAFEIPAESARCASDERTFLAVSDGRGRYWARPIRLQDGEQVDLVIERQVGRSIARVR
jgi:hypothetical protein